MTQVLKAERYKNILDKFPNIHLSVAGPCFPYMKLEYNNEWIHEDMSFHYPFESVHMIGTKDIYKDYFKTHLMYKDPLLIYYDEGHRFPKDYPEKDFEPLRQFLAKKLLEKNNESPDNQFIGKL